MSERGMRKARYAELEAVIARQAETIERLRPHLNALPPGEWETWTSCSFRRISRKGGADGDVLHALSHRSDGHPDLSWNERQCNAICAIVNGLRAALGSDGTGGADA